MTRAMGRLAGPAVWAMVAALLVIGLPSPAAAGRHAPRPVLVWVHGGGLATGAGCAGDGAPPAAVAACRRRLPVTALVGIPFLPLPSYGNPVPELPDQALLAGRFRRVEGR
jgi:hypothetical protein